MSEEQRYDDSELFEELIRLRNEIIREGKEKIKEFDSKYDLSVKNRIFLNLKAMVAEVGEEPIKEKFSSYVKIRSDITEKHIGLAIFRNYGMLNDGRFEKNDAIHSAVEFMLIAVDSFDPSFEVKFSTYASYAIKNGYVVARSDVRDVYVPRVRATTLNRIAKDIKMSSNHSEDGSPNLAWVCKRNGISMKELKKAIREIPSIRISSSLNAKVHNSEEDGNIEVLDTLRDENDPADELLDRKMISERCWTELDSCESLTKNESAVINGMFRLGKTGKAVAEELGMSRQNVDLIKGRGLKKLRRHSFFKSYRPGNFSYT